MEKLGGIQKLHITVQPQRYLMSAPEEVDLRVEVELYHPRGNKLIDWSWPVHVDNFHSLFDVMMDTARSAILRQIKEYEDGVRQGGVDQEARPGSGGAGRAGT